MRGILHIGTEKTGLTLLQKWLYSNQKNLSNQGIDLSNILGIPNNIYFPINFNGKFDKEEFSELISWSKKIILRILLIKMLTLLESHYKHPFLIF